MTSIPFRTWCYNLLDKIFNNHSREENFLQPQPYLKEVQSSGHKSINRIVKIKGKMIYVHSTMNDSNMHFTQKTQREYKKRESSAHESDTPEKMNEPVNIFLFPRKIMRVLFIISLILFFLSLTGIVLKYILHRNDFFTNCIVYFFDLSLEANVPTLFSSLLLFIAATFCFVIYKVKGSLENQYMKRCWLLLSIIFVFLTLDESSRIHEQFSKLHLMGEHSGYLHYSWIIPYGVFASIAGLYFLKFVKTLPPKTKIIFLVSGFVYVGSALGFEAFEGHLTVIYKGNNIYDKLLCSIEEMLEMSGMILFIYGLTDYLSRFNINIKILRAKTGL